MSGGQRELWQSAPRSIVDFLVLGLTAGSAPKKPKNCTETVQTQKKAQKKVGRL
jgi:hypothetical protein